MATLEKTKKQIIIRKKAIHRKDIPKYLVYEELEGKPVYYKGYKEVIKNKKTLEDIMGSSDLQSIIIDCILKFLYSKVDINKYKFLTNELGLHLDKNNNLSADIAIYERLQLVNHSFTGKYLDIPPRAVIEIDTKADLNDFDNTMDYFNRKTKKLFEFGVKQVFWILTNSRKIIAAQPNENWIVMDWDKEMNLLGIYNFSLIKLIEEDGIFKLSAD
jgi:hypothetical protein